MQWIRLLYTKHDCVWVGLPSKWEHMNIDSMHFNHSNQTSKAETTQIFEWVFETTKRQDLVVYMHNTHREIKKRRRYANKLAVKITCDYETHCHVCAWSFQFATVLVESPDDRLNTIRDCLINSVYMFLNISLLENAGLSFNFDALAWECFLRQFVLGRKTLKLQITDRAPIRMIFFSILS